MDCLSATTIWGSFIIRNAKAIKHIISEFIFFFSNDIFDIISLKWVNWFLWVIIVCTSNYWIILGEFSLNLTNSWTEKCFWTVVFIRNLPIFPICSPCSGIRIFEVLNVRYVCWFSMMERSWKSSILKIVKKDSVIPIRSKDGSEMEIVFIFKFNQPNQPIIFYNIQFKFILSFYAYDEIGFRIAFLPRSSVHLPSNDGRLSTVWFE